MKDRLRILMQTYGINQTELALKIGVSKMTISHIMADNGRGGGFKPETIEAIKKAFPTIDINWLIHGTGTAPLPIDETSLFGQPVTLPGNTTSAKETKDTEAGKETEIEPYQANETEKEYTIDPKNTSTKADSNQNDMEQEEIKTQSNAQGNTVQDTVTKAVEKQITRIVMFFSDGTFKEYKPE